MLLRKLVDNGHTILCTVHQPSAQLFNQFDRLLLLYNGEMLYFGDIGPDAAVLKQYFESRGAEKCPDGQNPAEWIMDVAESSSGAQTWSEKWKTSQESQLILEQSRGLETDNSVRLSTATTVHRDEETYGLSISRQFVILLLRVFRDQWRNPVYIYTEAAACVGLVCLFTSNYATELKLIADHHSEPFQRFFLLQFRFRHPRPNQSPLFNFPHLPAIQHFEHDHHSTLHQREGSIRGS